MDSTNSNLLYRQAQVSESDINIDERTVLLKFSSEYPVNRGRSYEVLSHKTGDYDLSYLNDNGPVLVQHNDQRQVGSVLSAWVENGQGYAKVRFSSKGEGDIIFTDIVDKIRNKISVGYSAANPKFIEKRDDIPVYAYQWVAREISIVGVGADPTAKIGRSEEIIDDLIRQAFTDIQIPHEEEIDNNSQRNEIMTTQDITADEVISAIESQTRTQEIDLGASVADLEKVCSHFRMEDQLEDLVARSVTLAEAKDILLEKFKARNAETVQKTRSIAAPAVHTRKQDEFSVAKAFQAATTRDWSKAGFEREMSQERAHQDGRTWADNTVVLDPNAKVRANAFNTAGGTGTGAELIGTTYMPDRLIDALWNKTFLKSLGTDEMLGLQGNASFPVISSNAVSVFQGENATLPDAQALTTGLKTIAPKQMVSKFGYSKQLLVQGLPNIEAKILDQLYKSIAQKLDEVAIANSGTTLTTTGLLNDVTQVVALGTNGAAPSLKTFHDLRTKLVNSKALQGNLGFAISGSLNEKLHTTLKDSANTASGYILTEGQNTIAGIPYVWSQNVPNNLTKGTGTGLSAAILGNWDDFLVAQWGSILVEVDSYTAADTGNVLIRSFSWWDMVIKRLESFAVAKDIITA